MWESSHRNSPANSRALRELIDAERALSVKQYTEAIDALRARAPSQTCGCAVRARTGVLPARENFARPFGFALCQKRAERRPAIFLDDLPTLPILRDRAVWLPSQEAIEMKRVRAMRSF